MHVVTAIAILSDSAANENRQNLAILTAGFSVSVSRTIHFGARTYKHRPIHYWNRLFIIISSRI